MGLKLTVTSPFDGYAVGDPITDPAKVAKILAERPHMVVKSASPVPEKTARKRP